MTLAFYMDAHVQAGITQGLRRRGIDVLTAQEDGADRLSDPDLLSRATALGRVLFSRDEDLLRARHLQFLEQTVGGHPDRSLDVEVERHARHPEPLRQLRHPWRRLETAAVIDVRVDGFHYGRH